MARWGTVDYKQLQQFSQKLEQLQQVDVDQFCRDMVKELAARLLRKAVKRTPVDTGTLRRGWTSKTQEEAESGATVGVKAYVDSLKINRFDNSLVIELPNPVEYAPYVEYGHRQTPGRYVPQIGKRLKEGWVKGRFMLTISVQELEHQMPPLLEKKLYAKLKEALK